MIATDIKKFFLPGLAVVVAVLSVSIWYGGRNRWALSGIGGETGDTSSASAAYEEKHVENPADPVLKYNLAYFYYQEQRYEEAEKLLLEILETPGVAPETVRNTAYNLGNVLFRLSEKAGRADLSLELLKRSISYFQVAIDVEKEWQSTAGINQAQDEDTLFNYTLVKKRIKILADMIAQQQKQQQQAKALYILLKELLEEEKQIRNALGALSSVKDGNQRQLMRDSLLKKQLENINRLAVVRQRINEVLKPQQQPARPSPPKI